MACHYPAVACTIGGAATTRQKGRTMAQQPDERPGPLTSPAPTATVPDPTICDQCRGQVPLEQLATTTVTITARGQGQVSHRYQTHRTCLSQLIYAFGRTLAEFEVSR